jgi:hypothetical protein
MKLVTFERGGRTSYGAVRDGGIVDLGARLGQDAPALIRRAAFTTLEPGDMDPHRHTQRRPLQPAEVAGARRPG